jgi:hypothetical protein
LYIPTCITNYDEFKHFFEHFRWAACGGLPTGQLNKVRLSNL